MLFSAPRLKQAYSFLLACTLIIFTALFLHLRADVLYCRLVSIPLILVLIWFAANSFRLSLNLNAFCLFIVTFEWLANYGKYGLTLPFFLILIFLDLKFYRLQTHLRSNLAESIICLISFTYFIQFLINVCLIRSYGDAGLLQAYNSLASGLFVSTLMLAYAYFYRRDVKVSSAKQFLVQLPFIGIFTLFALISWHEYFYAFNGGPQFALHAEWIAAQYVLFFWLILTSLRNFLRKGSGKLLHLIILAALAGLAYGFLPPYLASNNWDDSQLLAELNGRSILQNIFGSGYKWKLLFNNQPEYTSHQFPLSLISILFLEGGGLLVFLYSLLAAIFLLKFASKHFLSYFSIFCFAVAGMFFPLLRDPLTALVMAFCASNLSVKSKHTIKSLPIYPYEKGILYVVRAMTFAGLIFISFQVVAAGSKIKQGARNTNFDANFTLPQHFLEILMVQEDILFFRHRGFDFARLKKVFLETVESAEYVRGGSSISMQLAKVQYLDFDKTIIRKLQQAIAAVYLESSKSKTQILHEYLAVIGFAENTTGLSNAAKIFFSKRVEELTYDESLKIVLSIPDPLSYNATMPLGMPEVKIIRAIERRREEFRKLLAGDIKSYYLKP